MTIRREIVQMKSKTTRDSNKLLMSYVKLINAHMSLYTYCIFILLLLFLIFICQSVNIYSYETEQNRKEETDEKELEERRKKENEGGIAPKLILLSIGTSRGRRFFFSFGLFKCVLTSSR